MRIDICIVSYNRPDYLSLTLDSILRQHAATCRIDKIRLFQDGPRSDRVDEDRVKIDECVRAFESRFPEQHAVIAPANVGIVGNYTRLWSFLANSDADAAVVLEDDLVLAPHYLDVMTTMLERARHDPGIGLVSASGILGMHHALQDQRSGAVVPMSMALGLHRWGWGIVRETIQSFLPFKRLYFDIANGVGYRDNGLPPTDEQRNAIRRYFWAQGMFQPFEVLEIDAVYDLAALMLNRVNLTTYTSHARPIGRQGLHFSDDIFEQRGYADVHVMDEAPRSFAWYEPERLLDILSAIRRYHTNLNFDRLSGTSGRPSPLSEIRSAHLVRYLYEEIFGWQPTDQDLVAHGVLTRSATGNGTDSGLRNPEIFDGPIDERFGLLGLTPGGEKPYPRPYAA